MIETDVVGFENFLQANKAKIDPELLAAKMCGRWRNGVPLALSPDTDSPPGGIAPEQMNDFDYVNADGSGDPRGLRCPVGAHMRRINPRGQPVAGQGHSGGSNNTHRLIRRGMPYGPAYDPSQPHDGVERGLLGYFINSNIENQYEFVLSQWVNDAAFAGAVRLDPKSKDPMIGTQDPAESIFVIPQANGAPPIKVTGLTSFTTTKAAAYCFLPSITAIRFIAGSERGHFERFRASAGNAQVQEFAMLPMTRWFGVTFSDEERNLEAERACIDEIVERVLQMQAQAAAGQRRPLARGTHAKGIVARAKFEVFDVAVGHEPALAARLAKGIFAKPGVYPATVRFANADAHVNSDFKADVRALSFSVDLTRGGSEVQETGFQRQDFSLQNATVLPLNDAPSFLATMKFLTASNPAKGFVALSLRDKLRVVRALALDEIQARQKVKPYQQLRYWSNVPYRHGATDFVKQSASPSPSNPARPLQRNNSDALRDELARHVDRDEVMSSFDFGLQLLDMERMTYWGERRDASFWIENASVEWKESASPLLHRRLA